MNTFGERLSSIMALNNISQSELSRRSGVTRYSICRYCSGQRMPKTSTLLNICKALGVSADYLLGTEVK